MKPACIPRRRALASLTCVAAPWVLPSVALAQSRRPITLVVPFPAGGIVDVLARVIAEAIAGPLGQTVVVENRPGAATLVATQQVARAAPDGGTLLVTTTALAINALAHPRPQYDPVASFAPVVHLINAPALWIAGPSAKGRTPQELLGSFRTASEPLSIGTWGSASSTDIYAAMIQDATGVKLTRVPYKGEAPVVADTISGVLHTSFATVGTFRPQAGAGKLRPLALTGPRRSALLPDVPTFGEIGIPGPSVAGYCGIVAPARTPTETVQRVAAAVQEALRQPAIAQRIEQELAMQVVGAGPADFGKTIAQDLPRWDRAIKEFNIRME